MDQSFIQLRFFRDITDDQRIGILKSIGILPADFDKHVQYGIQQMLIKKAFKAGHGSKIGSAIDRITA